MFHCNSHLLRSLRRRLLAKFFHLKHPGLQKGMNITMTSRERVLSACRHQKTDRVPIDFFSDAKTEERLIRDLNLPDREALLERLHVDCRWLQPFFTIGAPHFDENGNPQDLFGVQSEMSALPNGAKFTRFTRRPLQEAQTAEDILSYPWPGEEDVFIHDFSRQIEMYGDKYALITGPWTPIFCQAEFMRGDENLLSDLVLNPEMAKVIFEKISDYFFAVAAAQFEALKGKADIFFTGDDFASQKGLMMSRAMWREFLFPHYKRLFSLAKDYGFLCMMHSCGAVSDLYPDFIEAGVDIIDPVQVGAAGMEIEKLKSAFGSRVAFHGAIDVQHLLPHEDPETVRRETLRTMRTLAQGGGYILCSTHELQMDIPTENVLAAYDAQFL